MEDIEYLEKPVLTDEQVVIDIVDELCNIVSLEKSQEESMPTPVSEFAESFSSSGTEKHYYEVLHEVSCVASGKNCLSKFSKLVSENNEDEGTDIMVIDSSNSVLSTNLEVQSSHRNEPKEDESIQNCQTVIREKIPPIEVISISNSTVSNSDDLSLLVPAAHKSTFHTTSEMDDNVHILHTEIDKDTVSISDVDSCETFIPPVSNVNQSLTSKKCLSTCTDGSCAVFKSSIEAVGAPALCDVSDVILHDNPNVKLQYVTNILKGEEAVTHVVHQSTNNLLVGNISPRNDEKAPMSCDVIMLDNSGGIISNFSQDSNCDAVAKLSKVAATDAAGAIDSSLTTLSDGIVIQSSDSSKSSTERSAIKSCTKFPESVNEFIVLPPDIKDVKWENCSEENTAESSFSGKVTSCKLMAESKNFGTDNYFKGCKWAPDGLCFLTNSNDSRVRIFNTPYQCLEGVGVEQPLNLEACLVVHEPGLVYDYCWWPLMNSREPVTCCFATTCSNQPVHLWDAFNGSLRASYICLNSVEEIAAAYSVCFSNDGQQLLCGYKKNVCLFYTDRPGSQFERWSTYKKKHHRSQKSIISCLDFCQDDTMFACGSYDGSVGIYSPVNGHLLDFTAAHKTGVTFLKFSKDGFRLYTGARKGNLIKCWDIRNVNLPIGTMSRQVTTNQQIYFDLVYDQTVDAEWSVVSGSTDGFVKFWGMKGTIQKANELDSYQWQTDHLDPSYSFKAHDDCVNGCGIHPFLPLLATTSGQRHFPEVCDSEDDSDILIRKSNKGINNVKLWQVNG